MSERPQYEPPEAEDITADAGEPVVTAAITATDA